MKLVITINIDSCEGSEYQAFTRFGELPEVMQDVMRNMRCGAKNGWPNNLNGHQIGEWKILPDDATGEDSESTD
jgi:hypothetical protein